MTELQNKKEIAKKYIQASVHYGHPPKEWNPKMAAYILGMYDPKWIYRNFSRLVCNRDWPAAMDGVWRY